MVDDMQREEGPWPYIKFNQAQFLYLVDDLCNAKLSNTAVARKHNVSREIIRRYRSTMCDKTLAYRLKPKYQEVVERAKRELQNDGTK